MNFIILKSSLYEAINVAQKCIVNNNVLPILGSYRFQIQNSELKITAGNMEVFLSITIPVSTLEECDIAIPALKLNGLIKELPEQPLDFTLTSKETVVNEKPVINYTLVIKSSTGKYNIPVELGTDYPTLKIENTNEFSIAADALYDGIDRTVFAVTEDLMKATGGLNIKGEGKRLNYMGCNGFIGGLYGFDQENEIADQINCIVPPRSLTILRGITPDDNVVISISNNSARFKVTENITIETVLINASYPALTKMVPVDSKNHIAFDRLQLIGVLKRLIPFASKDAYVELLLNTNECTIKTYNDLGENAEEVITVDYAAEPFKIAFNGNLFLSCLSHLTESVVHTSLTAPNMAIVLRENEAEINTSENCMLVMPIMLKRSA